MPIFVHVQGKNVHVRVGKRSEKEKINYAERFASEFQDLPGWNAYLDRMSASPEATLQHFLVVPVATAAAVFLFT